MIDKRIEQTALVQPVALRTRAWELRGTLADGAQVWRKDGTEVAFPGDLSLADYGLRLKLAIAEVAQVEGVSPDTIAQELSDLSTDSFYWSLETGVLSGEIDLYTLERSLNAIRRIHVYAAAAFEARRSLFGKRITRRARSMSQRLQVGLTREGSYILPVLAKSPPKLTERLLTQLVPEGEPFNFEAGSMHLLYESLQMLREQVDGDMGMSPDQLLRLVESGVSYELVVALIDLLETVRIERIDVRSVKAASDSVRRPLTFQPSDVANLKWLVERLYDSGLIGAEIVTATVKTTSRPEDSKAGGRVTLRRIGGSSKRSLLIADLNETDYQIALQADSRRDQVELLARVVEEPGRLPRLEQIEYLRRYVQTEIDLNDN